MNPSPASAHTYGAKFYAQQAPGSLQSARIVAALIAELLTPRKVVDVGCGLGGWLLALSETGAHELLGIDGDHVDRSKLYIDPACFTAMDLSRPFKVEGRFDLAICIEVAEHVPHAYSEDLVNALCGAAPVVLFSAALPGQGGSGHVNEQWPEYWHRRFHQRGFRMFDSIRPRIREEPRVRWWYRQNLVLYANDAGRAAHPLLGAAAASGYPGLGWVHVNMLRDTGVRNLMHHLRPALVSAIRRRVGLPDLKPQPLRETKC
jgi:SAM-dependent methyltransferase